MKSRPILFSAPMVRALLAGTKTQTRRIMKPQPPKRKIAFEDVLGIPGTFIISGESGWRFESPYGQPGDRLWVRERGLIDRRECRFFVYHATPGICKEATTGGIDDRDAGKIVTHGPQWKAVPAIHAPRWSSRITLEITGVRVERLQEMNRGDAMSEGCPFANMAKGPNPLTWYTDLWDSINGPGSWAVNPWVWVIEFKRVTP